MRCSWFSPQTLTLRATVDLTLPTRYLPVPSTVLQMEPVITGSVSATQSTLETGASSKYAPPIAQEMGIVTPPVVCVCVMTDTSVMIAQPPSCPRTGRAPSQALPFP